MSLTVRADPDIDRDRHRRPASSRPRSRIDVPAGDTFTATGTRVEETKAKGVVTLPERRLHLVQYRSPRARIVRTEGGVRFRTDAAVTVPAGQARPGRTRDPASEKRREVTAVKAGPDGNVAGGRDPRSSRAARTADSSGHQPAADERRHPRGVPAGHPGRRRCRAWRRSTRQLDDDFQDRLDGADASPEDITVFPETAVLGAATDA